MTERDVEMMRTWCNEQCAAADGPRFAGEPEDNCDCCSALTALLAQAREEGRLLGIEQAAECLLDRGATSDNDVRAVRALGKEEP